MQHTNWQRLRAGLEQDRFGRQEWPTWLLLIGVQAAWFAVLWASPQLGVWLSTALLIPLVTLWMSVQHEVLHGHPTRLLWLNKALAYGPYAIWYPYTLYRDSHLAHHRDESLTLPEVDPESRYLHPEHWQGLPAVARALHWLNKTVLGRLLIGAPLALVGLLVSEGRRLLRGERQAWLMWSCHGLLCAALLWWVQRYSALSAVHYVALVSVPALALGMLRSFYEHRPAAEPSQRSVLNEAGWPWRWLFLNLNLHLVHHDLPWLPWYRLPSIYRARREYWLARSGGFLVHGYGQLIRQHGVRPVDSPTHPLVSAQEHQP
jgi:fatty acid desaturase